MDYSFFALMFRQRYIRRWGLMRNVNEENLSEHCSETVLLTHALALIGNSIFKKNYDTGRAALLALYHDAPEVLTGDLPTPVKYHNEDIRAAYAEIEKSAYDMLLSALPPEIRGEYSEIFGRGGEGDGELNVLVHAADKLCAYIKCIEEEKSGNAEFRSAKASTETALKKLDCPELRWFEEHLLPAFARTLDENTPPQPQISISANDISE